MGFEDLKENIEQERRIISDINTIYIHMQSNQEEKEFYGSSINALIYQLKMLNDAVPSLLKNISPWKKLSEQDSEKPVKDVVRVSYISPSAKEKRYMVINKADKKKFLQELNLSESGMTNVKKKEQIKQKTDLNTISSFAKISNRVFSKVSGKIAPKFDEMADDLKKANIRFLTSTYISMALFASSILFVLSIIIFSILFAFSIFSISYVWTVIVLPVLSLVIFYFYPSSEKKSVQNEISYELPFVTIHMAAIAGSDIEPTKIFKIIASSSEYPAIAKEITKVTNQVEIYGYDLVTALKNVARRTSNKRLAELFSGLATNISSGGELKSYLEKKAENFLTDYRLEREQYSDLAGTFMDIYISILIAAPLVLMMMFIVMNVSGLNIAGLGPDLLLPLSIGLVVIINIIFIFVVNIKQPKV